VGTAIADEDLAPMDGSRRLYVSACRKSCHGHLSASGAFWRTNGKTSEMRHEKHGCGELSLGNVTECTSLFLTGKKLKLTIYL
jgi:hypothetical protein